MSQSQLTTPKSNIGINYASNFKLTFQLILELRNKKANKSGVTKENARGYSNEKLKNSDQNDHYFGMNMNKDNLNYIESLIHNRQSNPLLQEKRNHQRAKSTLEEKQKQEVKLSENETLKSYRESTSAKKYLNQSYQSNLAAQDLEGEKLFDQFFKLNNSNSDFIKKTTDDSQSNNGFLKFIEDSIYYLNKSTTKQFFSIKNKDQGIQQENRVLRQQNQQQENKMRELKMSNQILLTEIQKYKDNEQNIKKRYNQYKYECDERMKQIIQRNKYLEDLLAKQKIDNQNTILALYKVMSTCSCSKSKVIKDFHQDQDSNSRYSKRYIQPNDFMLYDSNKIIEETNSSSNEQYEKNEPFFKTNDSSQDEEVNEFTVLGNKYSAHHLFENKRKKRSQPRVSDYIQIF